MGNINGNCRVIFYLTFAHAQTLEGKHFAFKRVGANAHRKLVVGGKIQFSGRDKAQQPAFVENGTGCAGIYQQTGFLVVDKCIDKNMNTFSLDIVKMYRNF